MNEVVIAAVKQHNQEQQNQVVAAKVAIVSRISDERKRIKDCEARIKHYQDQQQELSRDVIDEARIFGGSVPTNANRETIVAVIEKANKDRQFDIEQRARQNTTAILAEQDAIVAINARITKLIEELNKTEVAEVTVEQVSGK